MTAPLFTTPSMLSVKQMGRYALLLGLFTRRLSRSLHQRRTPEPASPEVSLLLESYEAQKSETLTLSKLLSFGRPLTPESVIASASYTLSEIPRRLAKRINSLEKLPFIVGTNPYVATTLHAYRKSFLFLATYPVIQSLDDNARFARELEDLVQGHTNDIPTMAKGFQECERYMSPSAIGDFLDEAIRNRIAVRLIAEQHIALSRALNRQPADSFGGPDIDGVVNRSCSPLDMITSCASFVGDMCEATLGAKPAIVTDGQLDATFSYVPVHLEYMLTELLKNSFRATVEHQYQATGRTAVNALPPVQVTISTPSCASERDHPGFLSIRIRDEGGGVSRSNQSRIFSYAFTTAGRGSERNQGEDETEGGPYAAQHIGGSASIGGWGGGPGEGNLFGDIMSKGVQTGVGTIAGLGYGLPMSRLYARYFGGSLDLFSLDGWGTDVFLKLRCLDGAADASI